jgi:hypothetical protein
MVVCLLVMTTVIDRPFSSELVQLCYDVGEANQSITVERMESGYCNSLYAQAVPPNFDRHRNLDWKIIDIRSKKRSVILER